MGIVIGSRNTHNLNTWLCTTLWPIVEQTTCATGYHSPVVVEGKVEHIIGNCCRFTHYKLSIPTLTPDLMETHPVDD